MLVPVLLFIVGLVLLIKGGDWFVDSSVGIAKKLNLYLNLMKRNRQKPLPKLLFKAMRMNRMKFKD